MLASYFWVLKVIFYGTELKVNVFVVIFVCLVSLKIAKTYVQFQIFGVWAAVRLAFGYVSHALRYSDSKIFSLGQF